MPSCPQRWYWIRFIAAKTAYTRLRSKPATDIEIENVRTGCGCTGVEFPKGVLKAGEEYHLKVDVNTADIAGSFKSHVAVKVAGEDSLWVLSLQGQVVPPFPAEIDFGEIDFITLPLERHLSLAQIVDQPLAIDSRCRARASWHILPMRVRGCCFGQMRR